MKKLLILALSVILVLVAGCTTPSPTSPSGPGVPGTALPMYQSVILGNATHQAKVSFYSVEIDPQNVTGQHTVTIYVAANNTGKDPIKFVWFSKLTDLRGNSYGGIGLSHGGNGARTGWIVPNTTEAARDYVIVYSDQAFAALSKGAVLDVYFMEQQVNVTHPMVPDYHVTWQIDPDIIK